MWTTAVFLQEQLTVPPRGKPDFLLNTKRLFRAPGSPHTRADPFLVAFHDRLYCFYETQVADDFGRIEVSELTDTGVTAGEPVLSEPFHLSFPGILQDGETIYMLPETQGADEMRLYRFTDFPRGLVFHRRLSDGRFADPAAVRVKGVWYVFGTTSRGLELFFTEDIGSGPLRAHPASPITMDPRYRRCGGAPFFAGDRLLRPAQDGANGYGKNINLMTIETISPTEYHETLYEQDIFTRLGDWNSLGGHHLSIAPHRGGMAVAIDGQSNDYYIHKVVTRLWMLATNRKRR